MFGFHNIILGGVIAILTKLRPDSGLFLIRVQQLHYPRTYISVCLSKECGYKKQLHGKMKQRKKHKTHYVKNTLLMVLPAIKIFASKTITPTWFDFREIL